MTITRAHLRYTLIGLCLLALDFSIFWYTEVYLPESEELAEDVPLVAERQVLFASPAVKEEMPVRRKSLQAKKLQLHGKSARKAGSFSAPLEITVLSYHDLSKKRIKGSIITPQAEFEKMLLSFHRRGYQTFFASDIPLLTSGSLPVKEGHVPLVITFDDGYRNNYDLLFPLLKKHKARATIFLITSKIMERRTPVSGNGLTLAELREMSESGYVEFGSHTHKNHKNLVQLLGQHEPLLEKKRCLYAIYKDLKHSRFVLQEALGKKITTLAWPHGKENKNLIYAAKKAGFTTVFNTRFGTNKRAGLSLFSLKRISASSPWLTSRELLTRIESATSTGAIPSKEGLEKDHVD